ncbi:MAG TPA: F0F1 ATP synthase subunit B [Micromonosporaceae bacterium]|jgi:F-type H+-transporting ATPase subunit b
MAPTETVLAEGSNFLVPNATFFAELIAFLIILAILWRYVLPRVTQALDERQQIIRTQMEEADATKAKLAATEADYKARMQEAGTLAAQIRDEARTDATAIRDEILAKAREESDRIIAAGRSQLEAERAAVVRQLRNEVGTLAVDLAGRIVGESLQDEARQRGTIDRFMSEINAGAPARGGS